MKNQKLVSIIDYGCGNVLCIKRALEEISFPVLFYIPQKTIYDLLYD